MQSYLSTNIKFLRRSKGISQQKLAEAIGLKRNNIASYESSVVEPKAANLLKIARFFDVHPLQLLTENLVTTNLAAKKTIEQPEQLAEKIQAFVAVTTEMQQLLDGFTALKTFNEETPNDYFSKEAEQLLPLLRKVLDANWTMIQHLQQKQE